MFNMKTSDLFRRAKQLADLEGSDFISWNEAINCINESHVGLYERLINMGDNSFVKSFHTSTTVELPEDFWQLKGVYLYNNGNLQTINRRADNNGIHHLSYELRNGNIELFGNPNDVLVEYFPKPKQLFFKPSSVNVALPDTYTYLDCCGHLFLWEDTDNNTLNIHDVDEYKTVEGILTPGTKNYITKDYVIAETEGVLNIYDIASGFVASGVEAIPLVNENGELFLYADGTISRIGIGENDYNLTELKTIELDISGLFIVCDNNFEDFFYINNHKLYHNGIELNVTANKIVYSGNKCYFLADTFGYVTKDNVLTLIDVSTGRYIGIIGINERTGYGYATKKFNSYVIEPYCEDTELNFPNSFYFQIISYLLAIAFRSKQGADISLLSNQLAAIENTFEDTLGSDSFQFPRMGNVYN